MDKYVVYAHLSCTRDEHLYASVFTMDKIYNVKNFNPINDETLTLILINNKNEIVLYNSIIYINLSDKKPNHPYVLNNLKGDNSP